MTENECLQRMVAPCQRRPGVWLGGIIQIWVTARCARACVHCTQGCNLQADRPDITREQFRHACRCLADYWGVVGIFGGNPCLHPQFPELCAIAREYVPRKQLGLWTDDFCGHGEVVRRTFNPHVSNVNAHGDPAKAAALRRAWPEQDRILGATADSLHSPVWVALCDVINDESKRWELISRCDVNQRWSAITLPVRGKLQVYFCEIAGAMAQLHPEWPELGLPCRPGWWKEGIETWREQVQWYCHRCGIPLRLPAAPSNSDAPELATETHAAVLRLRRRRELRIIRSLAEIGVDRETLSEKPATDYLPEAHVEI